MAEVDIRSGSGTGGEGLGVKKDNNVIVIVDNDVTRRTIVSSSVLKDTDILCEFPHGQSPCITVTLRDYKTLELATFLNDTIIDFYLTWLHARVLPAEQKAAVHIFPTLFFKRLMQVPDEISLINSYEKDESLSQAQIRHTRVKGWSKKLNLFAKDMIIFPICEESHWYLVIVIKPGMILQDEEDKCGDKGPFVLVFDSLGVERSRTVDTIREYLDVEWKVKVKDPAEFSASTVPLVVPIKPDQTNLTDCGVYLLHYVEKIFTGFHHFLHPDLPSLENWFTLSEVSMKRHIIAVLLRGLTEKQQKQVILWPKLQLVKTNVRNK